MTKEFASDLRARMKHRNLSQRGLDMRSGVDHSTISRLLTGKRNAEPQVAEQLANGLRVPAPEQAEFLLRAAGYSPDVVDSAIAAVRHETSEYLAPIRGVVRLVPREDSRVSSQPQQDAPQS